MPDLSDAVDFIFLFLDTLNLGAQIHVLFGTIGRQIRVLGDRYMRIKFGLGDWQNLANRLDTQVISMLFYEGNHRLKGAGELRAAARQSSLAAVRGGAKYADAFLRISFAWRGSRISQSIALICARSSEVCSSLRPLSISDCLTQRRSMSLPHPILGAMAIIAVD
jgi:hypothetical protein